MFLITANITRHPHYISLLLPFANVSLQASYFSTTSKYLRVAQRSSPTVRLAERQRHHEQQREQRQQAEPLNSLQVSPSSVSRTKAKLWPSQALQEAAKSGQLSISAQTAEAVLEDVVVSHTHAWQTICSKHSIQPLDLTELTKFLINYGGPVCFQVAYNLLVVASQLKEPSGTLLLRKLALKYDRMFPLASLQHFKQMISENNYAAIYVQGQLYEAGKQNSLALDMYAKCLTSASEGYPGAEGFDVTLGEVWTGIFRLKIREGKEGAHAAIKRAALEYDEPSAYYLLAKEYTPQSSSEYEKYMLKAAASGKTRAADALGVYYFKQFQGNQSFSSKKCLNKSIQELAEVSEDFGNVSQVLPGALNKDSKGPELAKEWFNVGAKAKIPSSQVHLAVILRHEGKLREGLDWLERATGSKSWANTISWLKEIWESESIDFMQINLEKLRLRKDGSEQGV